MRILLATQNLNKVLELRKIITNPNIELISLRDLNDHDDIVENATTYYGNALLKANYYASKYRMPAIADDSGLEVDFLEMRPGIHSSRYNNGFDKNSTLLQEMVDVKNRSSRFVCQMIFVDPSDNTIISSKGILNGHLGVSELGSNGFGFDPIFIPEGYQITMGQMDADIKNRISHRGIASQKLIRRIEEKFLDLLPLKKKIFGNHFEEYIFMGSLLGGRNNHHYLYQIAGESVVLRRPVPLLQGLIDYRREKEHLELVPSKLINEMLYYDVSTGVMVTRKIYNNVAVSIKDVVLILKQLQKLKSPYELNPVNELASFEKLIVPSKEYFILKEFYQNEYSRVMPNVPFGFIHGDFHIDNILKDNNKTYLIDFEYSRNYDPLYDIASYAKDTLTQRKIFTKCYNRAPNDSEIKRLIFHRIYQCLYWYLFATYKENLNLSRELNINFLEVAELMLSDANEYVKELKGMMK